MRRPLCLFAAALSLSLAVMQFASSRVALAVCAVCAAAVLFIVLFLRRDAVTRPAFIVVFALFFAAGLIFIWTHSYIEPVYRFDERPSHITGYITDLESKTAHGYKYTLRCERIESGGEALARPFDIELYTNEPISAKPYERIRLAAIPTVPDTADSDRDMDTRAYLRSKGIYLTASLKSQLLMTKTGETCGSAFLRGALALKSHIIDTLFSNGKLSYENAALAAAVTTNYKGRLSSAQKAAFSSTGLSHVLAASGMHLSILVFGVLLLFRMIGVRRRYALLLSLAAVVGFAAVAGFSVSVVRSGVMFFVMAIALAAGKSYDSYTALACAATAILFHNPFAIGDAGFILSAVSTLGILLFYRPLHNTLTIKRRGAFFAVINYFLGLICVTLAATSLAVPFTMFIFGGVSLVAPLSNILVVPLIPVIFILCALTAIFSATPAGAFFAMLIEPVCSYILAVVGTLSQWSFSYLATRGEQYYIWVAFAAAAAIICASSGGRIKRSSAVCIILASLLFTGLYTGPAAPPKTYDTGFRLTVLDVGQGQCALLEGGGRVFVLDCGTSSYGYDAGEAASEYLKRNGVNHIDAVILSHYHDDHANGVARLISDIKTDMLIVPEWGDDDGVKESLEMCARESGADVLGVAHDSQVDAGELTLRIYADHMYDITGEGGGDYNANEKNLSIYIECGESSALIEGDMPGEDEGYLSQTRDMDTDVLLAAHHGSKYSSYPDFLNAATPNIAVISVGADNYYGHPSDETLGRLTGMGAHVFRTDTDGTVVIDTAGDGVFTVYHSKK
ncbi:MAG: DNA internalization-related competence protein ComEC/Rec2 [Clostridia bacterium]|nr:DNA internalization-related competence protein ComEC/Rec2 [Clostridia bacterium]